MFNLITANGTDLTIPLIIAITFITLFSIQYFLCCKVKNKIVRALPFIAVVVPCVLAIAALMSKPGGFLDLRGAVAIILTAYSAICLFAIVAARLVYWLIHKKK